MIRRTDIIENSFAMLERAHGLESILACVPSKNRKICIRNTVLHDLFGTMTSQKKYQQNHEDHIDDDDSAFESCKISISLQTIWYCESESKFINFYARYISLSALLKTNIASKTISYSNLMWRQEKKTLIVKDGKIWHSVHFSAQ